MRHILQNRVRENEALYQTALSIAYSGVFHNYINALTLIEKLKPYDVAISTVGFY